MNEENKVGPHKFNKIKFRPWLCTHCYAPRCLHPRNEWVVARPIGDYRYLSKSAPHFTHGY